MELKITAPDPAASRRLDTPPISFEFHSKTLEKPCRFAVKCRFGVGYGIIRTPGGIRVDLIGARCQGTAGADFPAALHAQ